MRKPGVIPSLPGGRTRPRHLAITAGALLAAALGCRAAEEQRGDSPVPDSPAGTVAGDSAAGMRVAADTTAVPPALARAVAAVAQSGGDPPPRRTSYRVGRPDLNGDARPDGLVYMYDPAWCGSGGCTLFVFVAEDTAYRLVSKVLLVHTPIIVSTRRTRGWRDLAHPVFGGGEKPRWVVLRFDGTRYPSYPLDEPSVPAGARVDGDTVFP